MTNAGGSTPRTMDEAGGAQDALRQSEELNRRIVEAVPGGVVHVGADGAILRANAEALRILGLRYDELTGRVVTDFDTETIREDGTPFPAAEYPVTRALVTGRSQPPATIGVRRKDGTIAWAVFRAVPVPEPETGATIGAVATFLEITERKHTEEALRASQEQWRALAESIPDFITMVDAHGTILSMNRVISGLTIESVIGTSVAAWVPPADRGPLLEKLARVFATGEAACFETDGVGQGGKMNRYEDRLAPVLASGKVIAAVLVARDISERVELLQQLKRSERMATVGLLAAGVAHEMNNPLAYVLANLSHVLERWTGDPEHREVLQRALEGAMRVRDIVRDLRTCSRDDGHAGEMVLDVHPVLDSAIQVAHHEIGHRAELVRAYQEVPPVVASEARLGQVVLNLLVNAAQAIPAHSSEGRIVLATSAEDGTVIIEVRDNGAGIAAEHLPQIFDPFFTTKPLGQGTGLGLSICYNLVDAMKGRIDVASDEGRGTTVQVRLPAAPAGAPAAYPGAARRWYGAAVNAPSLFERAERWLAHDPDPTTRAELSALLERARAGAADASADLAERFLGPLEFGTAGLRGLLGAGESRMNRAVVRRTSFGLGRYLLAQDEAGARARGVVIGYDGRHMGPELAEDTACVLAALGIPARVTPRPCPTPLLAFAVTDIGAAAGVMVTASHNPPQYNGYKVYWGNGAQIIPPHDKGIAACIADAPEGDAVPRAAREQAEKQGLVALFGDDVERRYLDAVRGLSVRSGGDRSIGIVYTPLHGTGNRLTRMALAEAGFTDVTTVPEQAEPDGAFPTVAFPNPEEKGALDLAFALAQKRGAPLVIANDPDVDRLALAVRDPSGKYVQLTGNQVGALLGHYVLTEGERAHGDRVVLASLVSSPMLGAIAKALGVRYEETLTGFKWIANRAIEIERETGARFVFGFEEALGYTVGPVVRDKDGISAAVIAAELAALRWAEGKTLLDELATLARRYGLFASGQRSITMPGSDGLAQIGAIMKRLREAPPARLGALEVLAVGDYQARRRTAKDGTVTPITLPPSNVLTFDLEGGSRIIARPSGTEPKIKFYFDLREPLAAGEAVADAERRAAQKMDELVRAFTAAAGAG